MVDREYAYLRHENNINFEPRICMKSYHQRKTFCEIFATFNFVIVLFAAQENRKIESDIEFSGHRDQACDRGVFTRETVFKTSVSNDGKIPGFVFVSFLFFSRVIKFDKKCANSTQRSQWPNNLVSKTRLFITR